jgi:hypothetical protein
MASRTTAVKVKKPVKTTGRPRARASSAPPVSVFRFDIDSLPPLLRLTDIVRDRKRGYPGLVPVSRAAWLNGVAEGRFPSPVKLGKVVAWKKADVLKVLRDGAAGVKRTSTFAELTAYPQQPAE